MTADNKQQTAADGRTLVIAAAGTGGHVMPGLHYRDDYGRHQDAQGYLGCPQAA